MNSESLVESHRGILHSALKTDRPRKMSQVRVLVMYDGKWFCSPSGYYLYSGGQTKGIIVSDDITYKELVDRLYGIVKVDTNEYVITMKSLYKANIPTMPVEIVDDDDVRFFIQENAAHPTELRSPICITIEHKGSQCQETEGYHAALDHQIPAASRSESNQISVVVPGMQATEVEEQNLNAFNDDPVAANFGTEAPLGCGDGILAANIEVSEQQDDIQRLNLSKDDCGDKLPIRRSNTRSAAVNPFHSYEDIVCGKTFTSKKDLIKKLKLGAAKKNFAFKVSKSTKDRFEVVCADTNCKWRLRATKTAEDEYFEIRRFSNIHICTQPPAKNRKKQTALQRPDGERGIRKCGRCSLIGHNRQTCKNFTPS